ncbi:hypothetical protein OSB04_un001396 [Centaurea solstitialis]|uniref:Uncharacterized protein n=1 Tax=Centaurea solstitialis TaxID=347529 RepID=A0AA38S4E6_9ASTR|nr:hypothetical protein OSB04_un001396 [Centaurea solstitialis]
MFIGFEMSKAQIPICSRRFRLITGFCSDSTCYNTCKSTIGIGSTGKCDGFWTCVSRDRSFDQSSLKPTFVTGVLCDRRSD